MQTDLRDIDLIMVRALAVAALMLSAPASQAETQFVFTVTPESQAVITRDGEVVRVEPPGLHVSNPLSEEVAIYNTFMEQEYVFEQLFETPGYPGRVSFIYRIGDVIAWHKNEGDLPQILGLRSEIQAAFLQLRDRINPADEVRRILREANIPGLQIVHVNVNFIGANPIRPRIEMRQIPLPRPENAGSLGTEKVLVSGFEATFLDDKIIRFEDVYLTYDVLDDTLLRSCFGDRFLERGLRGRFILHTRIAMGSVTLADMSVALERIPSIISARERLEQRCGVRMGHADFRQASLSEQLSIRCDTAPNEPECQ